MRIASAVVAIVLAAVAAEGVTIAPGDVATMPVNPCCCILCPPPPQDVLAANDGTLKQKFDGSALAFGPNGHLFVNTFAGLTEYDTSMNVVHTIHPVFSKFTIAPNGDIYTLTFSMTIAILSPSGAVKQMFTLPNPEETFSGLQVIDVAPDQCTVFYTDAALHGHRFNTCTGQPLADLAPGTWNALRAMSDGGYLAANGGTLSVFDANNQLLRSYVEQPWTIRALAFDADPRFVWIGVGTASKMRLADGTIVGIVNALFSGVEEIAVNGEQRSAAADLSTNIPALSPPLLFALALGLTALAWQRLRM